MRVDLHCHSTASDGTESPAGFIRQAVRAGVDVVALTDHDTQAGVEAAAAALVPGLVLVAGAEISCAWRGPSGQVIPVHLLAYLFDPAEPMLAGELAALRSDRERRAQRMVDKLVELGVPLDHARVASLAAGGAVGRPHVARALVELGIVPDVSAAFTDEWIGNSGRAYVDKRALDPVQAVTLVRAAGGVPVFAHPAASKRGALVPESVVEAMAAAGLAALEVDHPDQQPDERERLRVLASSLGLLVTGSSDDHGELTGHRIGSETTKPEVYEALLAQATGAAPRQAL